MFDPEDIGMGESHEDVKIREMWLQCEWDAETLEPKPIDMLVFDLEKK
jgi:hypothetical protein